MSNEVAVPVDQIATNQRRPATSPSAESCAAPALTSSHRVEIIDRGHIRNILAEWQALAESAAEPNVYYAPSYALSLLDTVERSSRVRFVTVWRDGKLAALLPAVKHRLSLPGLRPSASAWISEYTYTCTPLIAPTASGEAATALLAGMAEFCAGDWLMPQMNLDGDAAAAFTEALGRRGCPWRAFGTFERSYLESGPTFKDHMARYVSSNRRKGLARRRRRLEEQGKVAHQAHTSGAGLASAIDAFLRLEASGWKGKRATALASTGQSRSFALRAFDGSEHNPCRADLLLLDNRPIAAAVTVFSGGTGFTVKVAYDEAYATYGAGLLLEVEMMRDFLDGSWANRLDAATDGKHVIDELWPGRRRIGTLALSFAGTAPEFRVAALEAGHAAGAKVKVLAKRLLRR
jgi:CelD/BcsL family acetyltransferase involved in cellulose biosynthesis